MTSATALAPGLPAALSSFVGREKESADLAELLELARLVTLSGAPGIGKTRLALEVAGPVVGRYPDGARLVDLSPIGDPALLPRALANAFSVEEMPGAGLIEAELAYVAEREMLLIVDNCEHVIDACAKLVEVLLQGCPGLSILATSREALALDGEHVWQVSQLSVPAVSDPALPELLMSYESVRLFVDRARAARPDFVLDARDAAAVAEISRRLDGIPLAIELAAARVDMLTPAQIAGRLDNRFALLSHRSRSHLAHHQALEGALDWSHDQLSAPQRTLFRRLAAFVGGFSLEACEAVCADGPNEQELFHLLARLVAKSLVLAETTGGRDVRYRLLETIRAYASERLEESGEAALIREAHARAYLALAEQAEPELVGPSAELWLDRLDADQANLRSALQWSVDHGHADWALRIGGALTLFWRVRCYFSEGRELLEAALRSSDPANPGLRAKARWGAGYMTFMAGDLDGARPALEESLVAFRELGDKAGCARALLILGNSGGMRREPVALSQLEESAALARDAGDTWCLAHALAVAGYVQRDNGDLPAARPLFEECVAVSREARDKHGRMFGLDGLADVAMIQGDYRLAASLLEDSLATASELGAYHTQAKVLQRLGVLALRQGEYTRARMLLNESLGRLPERASAEIVPSSLLYLAGVAHAEGDHRDARRLVEDAVERLGRAPAYAMELLGELAVEEGDHGEARRLFEARLEVGRARGDRQIAGGALHELGLLARSEGNGRRAGALHDEALGLQREIAEAPAIAASLEALGGLAAAQGRHEHGARLLGAANGLRERNGYARTPRESARYEADLSLARDNLTAEAFESALVQGAELPMDEAVTLASKGRKRRVRPSCGWTSLTETEKQVAALVAEGLSNPQIAERMFIARATVKTHLRHIFSKLGVSTRRELEREVERHREPSPPGVDGA